MNDILYAGANGVEFEPKYSEIEFMLSEYDSETDPLNTQDNVRDINWHTIREQASVLLEQCFDLRVVLWLMRANLHIDGFSAFYQGIVSIDRQCSGEINAIFPQADIDQKTDSIHAAALGWLATSSCIHEIKNSRIFPDILLTTDELINSKITEQEGKGLHFSEIVKIIGQADTFFATNNLPPLKKQIVLEIEALERVEKHANLHAGNYHLDCHQVLEYLRTFLHLLKSIEKQDIPDGPNDADDEINTVINDESKIITANKNIRSRHDVILLLDQVLEYFNNYEPSHPAPILIRRSQKMVGMDFVAIVEELLPESITLLNQLSGK